MRPFSRLQRLIASAVTLAAACLSFAVPSQAATIPTGATAVSGFLSGRTQVFAVDAASLADIPVATASDGAIFFADPSNGIRRLTYGRLSSFGALSSNAPVANVQGTTALAADKNGTVYAAYTTNNTTLLRRYTRDSFGNYSAVTIDTAPFNFNTGAGGGGIAGISVAPNLDVYFVGTASGSTSPGIYRATAAAGGGYNAVTALTTFCASGTKSIAVDASGGVYFASNGTVNKLKANPTGFCSANPNNAADAYATIPGLKALATNGAGQLFASGYDNNATAFIARITAANTFQATAVAIPSAASAVTLAATFDGASLVGIGAPSSGLQEFIYRFDLTAVNLGQSVKGSFASSYFAQFGFAGSTTLSSTNPRKITAGVATGSALDFTATGTGVPADDCAASTTYSIGAVCAVQVGAQGKEIGARAGYLSLLDSTGAPVQSVPVGALVGGPRVRFQTSTPSNFGNPYIETNFSNTQSNTTNFAALATDAAGELYVADRANARILRAHAVAGDPVTSPETIVSGLSIITGLATDGQGGVFYVDNFQAFRAVQNTGGTYTPVAIGAPVNASGIAADRFGNVYVSAYSNGSVAKGVPSSTSLSTYSWSTIATGLGNLRGVAVAPNGTVYVIDSTASKIKTLTPAADYNAYTVTDYPASIVTPAAVAVDLNGNVFYTDIAGAKGAYKTNAAGSSVLIASRSNQNGIAVAPDGTVYIASSYAAAAGNLPASGDVYKYSEQATLTANYPDTAVGATSSLKSVNLLNTGNADLFVFTPPSGVKNPAIGADFFRNLSDTCPNLTSSSSPFDIVGNSSCSLDLQFKPTVAGPISELAEFTTSANNGTSYASGSKQSVTLTGNIPPAGQPTKVDFGTLPATTVTAGGNLGTAVTVKVQDSNSTTVTSSTAAVTLTVTDRSGAVIQTFSANAVNGVATFNTSTTPLTAAGTFTVTAASTGLTSKTSALTVTAGPAASLITVTSSTPQSVTVNQAFRYGLTASVQDQYGNGVSGAVVTYTVTPNAGASAVLSATSATTDSAGSTSLQVTATANGTVGSYTVTAANGGRTATFNLTNTSATVASFTVAAGATPQSTAINTNFAQSLVVTLYNASGQPVAGQTVTFTAPATGASAASTTSFMSSVTGAEGVAGLQFKANGVAGTYAVNATFAGFTQAFNLTNTGAAGVATKLAFTTPPPTTLVAGANFGSAITVKVQDANGATVTGANNSLVMTLTDPNGALVLSQTGNAASGSKAYPAFALQATISGVYTFTVTSAGLTQAVATTTVTPGPPAYLTADTGTTPQSAPVNTAFATNPSIHLTDGYNNPISGTSITFTAATVAGATATFTGGTTSTNASGFASAVATANGTAGGPYTVTATSGTGLTATFQFTNTLPVGPPASLSVNADVADQSAAINTAFTRALAVTVKDSNGTGVPNVTVTFTAPASGATAVLSATTAVTNASGVASVTAVANGTTGTYNVVATANSFTANIALNNTPAPGAAYKLDARFPYVTQYAMIGKQFALPLLAVLTDAAGNPVAGQTVTYAVDINGNNQSGGTLSSTTAVTDSSGQARVFLTANFNVGGYDVRASAGTALNLGTIFYPTNLAANTLKVLPDGGIAGPTFGLQFTSQFSAQGGSGNYTFSVSAGTLPAGLSIDPNTGAFTGTDTAAAGGVYNFTVKAVDNANPSYIGTSQYQQTVSKQQGFVSFNPASLSQTADGTPKSVTVTTSPVGLPTTITYSNATYPASTTPPSAPGVYTVVATISDTNYNTIQPNSTTFGLNGANNPITFTIPDHLASDAPFQVTATAPSPGAFTYTLQDGPASVTANGIVTLTGGNGVVTIRATQASSGNYAAGQQDASFTVTGGRDTTVTTLTSSANPATAGSTVTLTAKVTGANATPTGTVQFIEAGVVVATVAVDGSGNATYSTGVLAVGTRSFVAKYSGSTTYNTSTSNTLTQITNAVAKVASTVTFTSSANPTTEGSIVTLIAKVTGGSGTPTGTVTFLEGALGGATITLDATGTATAPTSALSAGIHNYTATYNGSATYNTSVATLAETVNSVVKVASTTTLTSSSTPAAEGKTVTLTAKVAGASGIATGTVVFTEGTTTLATATLDGTGAATYTTSALAVGDRNFTATYNGSAVYSTSVGTLTQTTKAAAFTSSNGNSVLTTSISLNSPTSVTLTLTPGINFSGTITFSCGNLPAFITCSFTPPSGILQAGGQPLGITLTFNNIGVAQLNRPQPFVRDGGLGVQLATFLGLPSLLMLGLGLSGRRKLSGRLLLLAFLLIAFAGVGVVSGCGGSPATSTGTGTGTGTGTTTKSVPGTYNINVIATPTVGTAVTLPTTLVVN